MSTRQSRLPAERGTRPGSRCGFRRSAIALAVAALLSSNAHAQEAQQAGDEEGDEATELDAVVVTGVRASLTEAQKIKQNAEQIVDSIVAEDIGKLPDASIADALQRITGVQIRRDVREGNSIAIRGLTQVRSELNGRDIFTANQGRSLSFDDVPAELLAGIDVYKNPAADIIEGGIGGTINLRTRMPFDFDGMKISGSAQYNKYDLVDDNDTAYSGLFSNRWDTGIGEIGLLVNMSYQDGSFREDVIAVEPFFEQSNFPVNPAFVPRGAGIGTVFGERRRKGGAVALQWKPNDDVEVYLQVQRADYDFKWRDYSYFAYTGGSTIVPGPGPFEFNAANEFVSGNFAGVDNDPAVDSDGDGNPGNDVNGPVPIDSNTSIASRHSVTTDYAVGARWQVTDQLKLSTDFQYIDASTESLRYIVSMNTVGAPLVQLDLGGDLPTMSVNAGDPNFLTNPANYGWGWHLDHLDDNDGDQFAWRGDAEFQFDNDHLQLFKGGVRYTDRSATTRESQWRWMGIFQPLSAFPDAQWQINPFGNFFRNETRMLGPTIGAADSMVADYENTLAMFGGTPLTVDPAAINEQSEKTYAAYGMLRFGFNAGSMPVEGNVGVRLVRTETGSQGTMIDPDGSGELLPVNVENSYNSTLPSLNVRMFITNELQWRFAAAKAIARPDFYRMRANLFLDTTRDDQGNLTNPVGSGGNPDLEPITSTQFDTALEWYYGDGAMLYGTLFYKDVDNFFADVVQEETYNGDVYQVTRPVNLNQGKIRGAEIGWQQFFDFLPGWLSHFGAQANYTYVDSEAPGASAVDASGNPIDTPLEGLSKNSYNAVLMYETEHFGARVAYNWRSDYLLTTAGNGTGALPIYGKDYGQLDASFRYNISEVWSVTLDGTNLLDTRRESYQASESRPRDFALTDRRYGVTLRANF